MEDAAALKEHVEKDFEHQADDLSDIDNRSTTTSDAADQGAIDQVIKLNQQNAELSIALNQMKIERAMDTKNMEELQRQALEERGRREAAELQLQQAQQQISQLQQRVTALSMQQPAHVLQPDVPERPRHQNT